ncbi:hypothetical protein [Candidatus Uabimicrobium sp. HlEnr_7]|uniref:hypothetical protein n=1 Tax=Candidatus Uabimicrobium helgolandensis TaxID=3095367 RepID=UPI003558E91E
MKKVFLLIFVLMMLLQAQQWKTDKFSAEFTTEPYWAEKSKYADSHYQGTLITTCKVSALKGSGFPGLIKHLKKWFEDQSATKKWTITKDYFTIKRNGKIVKIDAITMPYTNLDKSETGKIKMQLNAYIGHDPNNVLVVESVSQKIIESTGDKKRLKTFRSFYRYYKDKKQGYYNVYCWRFYKLEGYWYEPTGIFVSSARKKTLKSFRDAINRWSKVWAKNL